MKLAIRRLKSAVQSCATNRWYLPFIAALSALDAFILVIPNEALLIPGVLARPRAWAKVGFSLALGSAIGATCFAWAAMVYGKPFLNALLPELLNSAAWQQASEWLNSFGVAAVSLIAVSPLPQHPMVAMAALAHVALLKIFLAVLAGRATKYLVLAWITKRSASLATKASGRK